MSVRRALLLLAPLALAAACGGASAPLSSPIVVGSIPWTPPERAVYRLLDGDEAIGTGELLLEERDGALLVSQRFAFPERGLSDEVSVLVDGATLRPQRVDRLIDGPEGQRVCQAEYAGNTAIVEQRAGDEQRRDELTVPTRSYDSWADLFLWRTLPFAEGYEATYQDVLTCTLARPQILKVALAVKGVETVTVPAGAFQTWRLEIRSGSRTQRAWYTADEARTLVRYDNGDLVFELEELD